MAKKLPRSIYDCVVRVRFPRKRQGRPTKYELHLSQLMSDFVKDPQNAAALQKAQEDLALYGVGAIVVKDDGKSISAVRMERKSQ